MSSSGHPVDTSSALLSLDKPVKPYKTESKHDPTGVDSPVSSLSDGNIIKPDFVDVSNQPFRPSGVHYTRVTQPQVDAIQTQYASDDDTDVPNKSEWSHIPLDSSKDLYSTTSYDIESSVDTRCDYPSIESRQRVKQQSAANETPVLVPSSRAIDNISTVSSPLAPLFPLPNISQHAAHTQASSLSSILSPTAQAALHDAWDDVASPRSSNSQRNNGINNSLNPGTLEEAVTPFIVPLDHVSLHPSSDETPQLVLGEQQGAVIIPPSSSSSPLLLPQQRPPSPVPSTAPTLALSASSWATPGTSATPSYRIPPVMEPLTAAQDNHISLPELSPGTFDESRSLAAVSQAPSLVSQINVDTRLGTIHHLGLALDNFYTGEHELPSTSDLDALLSRQLVLTVNCPPLGYLPPIDTSYTQNYTTHVPIPSAFSLLDAKSRRIEVMPLDPIIPDLLEQDAALRTAHLQIQDQSYPAYFGVSMPEDNRTRAPPVTANPLGRRNSIGRGDLLSSPSHNNLQQQQQLQQSLSPSSQAQQHSSPFALGPLPSAFNTLDASPSMRSQANNSNTIPRGSLTRHQTTDGTLYASGPTLTTSPPPVDSLLNPNDTSESSSIPLGSAQNKILAPQQHLSGSAPTAGGHHIPPAKNQAPASPYNMQVTGGFHDKSSRQNAQQHLSRPPLHPAVPQQQPQFPPPPATIAPSQTSSHIVLYQAPSSSNPHYHPLLEQPTASLVQARQPQVNDSRYTSLISASSPLHIAATQSTVPLLPHVPAVPTSHILSGNHISALQYQYDDGRFDPPRGMINKLFSSFLPISTYSYRHRPTTSDVSILGFTIPFNLAKLHAYSNVNYIYTYLILTLTAICRQVSRDCVSEAVFKRQISDYMRKYDLLNENDEDDDSDNEACRSDCQCLGKHQCECDDQITSLAQQKNKSPEDQNKPPSSRLDDISPRLTISTSHRSTTSSNQTQPCPPDPVSSVPQSLSTLPFLPYLTLSHGVIIAQSVYWGNLGSVPKALFVPQLHALLGVTPALAFSDTRATVLSLIAQFVQQLPRQFVLDFKATMAGRHDLVAQSRLAHQSQLTQNATPNNAEWLHINDGRSADRHGKPTSSIRSLIPSVKQGKLVRPSQQPSNRQFDRVDPQKLMKKAEKHDLAFDPSGMHVVQDIEKVKKNRANALFMRPVDLSPPQLQTSSSFQRQNSAIIQPSQQESQAVPQRTVSVNIPGQDRPLHVMSPSHPADTPMSSLSSRALLSPAPLTMASSLPSPPVSSRQLSSHDDTTHHPLDPSQIPKRSHTQHSALPSTNNHASYLPPPPTLTPSLAQGANYNVLPCNVAMTSTPPTQSLLESFLCSSWYLYYKQLKLLSRYIASLVWVTYRHGMPDPMTSLQWSHILLAYRQTKAYVDNDICPHCCAIVHKQNMQQLEELLVRQHYAIGEHSPIVIEPPPSLDQSKSEVLPGTTTPTTSSQHPSTNLASTPSVTTLSPTYTTKGHYIAQSQASLPSSSAHKRVALETLHLSVLYPYLIQRFSSALPAPSVLSRSRFSRSKKNSKHTKDDIPVLSAPNNVSHTIHDEFVDTLDGFTDAGDVDISSSQRSSGTQQPQQRGQHPLNHTSPSQQPVSLTNHNVISSPPSSHPANKGGSLPSLSPSMSGSSTMSLEDESQNAASLLDIAVSERQASGKPFASLTSDSGWGCMLRSAQMMLATCLIRHFESNSIDQKKPVSYRPNNGPVPLILPKTSSQNLIHQHNLVRTAILAKEKQDIIDSKADIVIASLEDDGCSGSSSDTDDQCSANISAPQSRRTSQVSSSPPPQPSAPQSPRAQPRNSHSGRFSFNTETSPVTSMSLLMTTGAQFSFPQPSLRSSIQSLLADSLHAPYSLHALLLHRTTKEPGAWFGPSEVTYMLHRAITVARADHSYVCTYRQVEQLYDQYNYYTYHSIPPPINKDGTPYMFKPNKALFGMFPVPQFKDERKNHQQHTSTLQSHTHNTRQHLPQAYFDSPQVKEYITMASPQSNPIIKQCISRAPIVYGVNDLTTCLCYDGEIYYHSILRKMLNRGVVTPTLVMVNLALGLDIIDPQYYLTFSRLFSLMYFIGCIGGVKNSSLYFYGIQNGNVLYLDPHTTQKAVYDHNSTSYGSADNSYTFLGSSTTLYEDTTTTAPNTNHSTTTTSSSSRQQHQYKSSYESKDDEYFNTMYNSPNSVLPSNILSVPIKDIDPSMSFCFYLPDVDALSLWWHSLQQLLTITQNQRKSGNHCYNDTLDDVVKFKTFVPKYQQNLPSAKQRGGDNTTVSPSRSEMITLIKRSVRSKLQALASPSTEQQATSSDQNNNNNSHKPRHNHHHHYHHHHHAIKHTLSDDTLIPQELLSDPTFMSYSTEDDIDNLEDVELYRYFSILQHNSYHAKAEEYKMDGHLYNPSESSTAKDILAEPRYVPGRSSAIKNTTRAASLVAPFFTLGIDKPVWARSVDEDDTVQYTEPIVTLRDAPKRTQHNITPSPSHPRVSQDTFTDDDDDDDDYYAVRSDIDSQYTGPVVSSPSLSTVQQGSNESNSITLARQQHHTTQSSSSSSSSSSSGPLNRNHTSPNHVLSNHTSPLSSSCGDVPTNRSLESSSPPPQYHDDSSLASPLPRQQQRACDEDFDDLDDLLA